MSNIRQNLVFAFVYNAAGIPIAAGVLYPVFGWLFAWAGSAAGVRLSRPWNLKAVATITAIAAAAMALSSVSVITNALRLRTTHL